MTNNSPVGRDEQGQSTPGSTGTSDSGSQTAQRTGNANENIDPETDSRGSG